MYTEQPLPIMKKRGDSSLAFQVSASYEAQRDSSLTNEFVISQAEMGPISAKDYNKMKDLPRTMLEDK